MASKSTGNPAPLSARGVSSGGAHGVGSHGGGSEAELHNTLIASGPAFKSGIVSDIPSGNIDIAPTIMTILGSQIVGEFDGRVLTEALVDDDAEQLPVTENKPERGTIKFVSTGDATYICRFG